MAVINPKWVKGHDGTIVITKEGAARQGRRAHCVAFMRSARMS